MSSVPDIRLREIRHRAARPEARFVLYWMLAYRRLRHNAALERAVEWAREIDRPLVVIEHLPCGLRWDSDRHHAFVLQGMADNAADFAGTAAHYRAMVDREAGQGTAALAELTRAACVIVADDFPCWVVPELTARLAGDADVLVEAVDANGLLPMRAADRVFPTAHSFRRFLQKTLPAHLRDAPKANALANVKLRELDEEARRALDRLPLATEAMLACNPRSLAQLPIDHDVAPSAIRGGPSEAAKALRRFVETRLERYDADHNHPDRDGTSNLSPYLHHGHVSVHDVFARVVAAEDWSPGRLGSKTDGSRSGWWGMSPSAEGFLDELVTWREVGYNMAWQRDDYAEYASLPDWARTTLEEHAGDRREYVYSLDEFRTAATHDALWNAAQRQLAREGRLHNYLRMLWGKKILEWTASPQEALEVMVELNNAFGLDGRNPNSYSGIFWTLGRYDHAWGPQRAVFGKVRFMSSANTARKVDVTQYLETYGA